MYRVILYSFFFVLNRQKMPKCDDNIKNEMLRYVMNLQYNQLITVNFGSWWKKLGYTFLIELATLIFGTNHKSTATTLNL